MIFKMVLTYIVLTQQVLILCYLENMLLCTKLCPQMSLAQIPLFVRNYNLSASKFKTSFNWAAYSLIPNLTDTQHINILPN